MRWGLWSGSLRAFRVDSRIVVQGRLHKGYLKIFLPSMHKESSPALTGLLWDLIGRRHLGQACARKSSRLTTSLLGA
ncbi:hypothetical protein [Helicobacter canis]|uniref:hypothetical protein n=1 Tax=Helicobacter canis TaxID=29419 RepID=UPI0026F06618|nr:hypothetical protein [Helicobacter canis]